MATLSLDAFKDAVRHDVGFRESIISKSDIWDFDNGSAIIHRPNINKYLEKYICKSEEELEDTLYYQYGIYVKIVD